MEVFDLKKEQEWNPKHHVEKILGEIGEGDVTVACWEPGQISPNHCHPHATEIYFCFEGGGQMRTPREAIDVVPGSWCIHRASCTNTATAPPARSSSACAMGPTCRAAISSGAAMRSGSRRPATPNISARTHRGERVRLLE
jgi:hypothetical protein